MVCRFLGASDSPRIVPLVGQRLQSCGFVLGLPKGPRSLVANGDPHGSAMKPRFKNVGPRAGGSDPEPEPRRVAVPVDALSLAGLAFEALDSFDAEIGVFHPGIVCVGAM